MNLLIFLLTLSFVNYICCESSCNTHKTCGACIGHAMETCVWCSENKTEIAFRCQPESYNITNVNWCNKNIAVFPFSDPLKIKQVKQDSPFSPTVQFRPQEIKIKASPGVDVNFDISYKPAKDFPLDVYFLMDYSYTMKTHREALQKQAMEIYKGLTAMTQDVVLGVGSFVEKPGMPYTDIKKTKNTTYAFRNHLNLTKDMDAFKHEVQGSEYGSNYDDAEAGLDALMQVMLCGEKVGWKRTQTRRIIVLATDNTYHSAGDGKMLGAIKPNKMECLLKDNEYKQEDSLVYDYPSVSLINKVAREGNFLIIFAGTSKVQTVYEALSDQISGSKYAMLQEKSNILEIIKSAYDESVKAVEIGHDASDTSFRVFIDQKCKGTSKKNCESTPNNPEVSIPVTIRSIKCQKSDSPVTITINPLGLNEKLKITFEVVCQCDCEKTSSKIDLTRENCNNRGSVQCGACKCDDNWGGDTCQVSCSDETSMVLEEKCFPTNSTNKCNGHGKCECGKCTCTDGFTGDVCEYDPNSCDTGNNGKICGGSDHGSCQFGKCDCKDDWIGDACDCLVQEKSLKQCTGPFSKKVCYGRGQCHCGKCNCEKVNNLDVYSGAFCDICEECAIERCQELQGYAKCIHNQDKKICDEKFNLTAEINLDVLVDSKRVLDKKEEWKTGTQCRAPLDDETSLLYKYNADKKPSLDMADTKTSKMLLMIQKEVEVAPQANILVAIASAIAGILLIGLLTVVFWKVLIEMYDKREYAKFCNEAKSQGFDVSQNPLYESPTQDFVNPEFNRNIS